MSRKNTSLMLKEFMKCDFVWKKSYFDPFVWLTKVCVTFLLLQGIKVSGIATQFLKTKSWQY